MAENMDRQPLDLAKVRAELAGKRGRQYWQALDQIAESDEFKELLYNEFPPLASEWSDDVSRRKFLKLMGASLALAGITQACGKTPREQILPYVNAPENVVPGEPLYFASTLPFGGFGKGVLVESHMGRPTKVEGNPDHPGSLGGTDVFMQASILTMYDPDRSRTVINAGSISTWGRFALEMGPEVGRFDLNGGAGLRILTGTVTSPTLAARIRALLEKYPEARWHRYEPVNRDNAFEGARMAFGEYVNTVYRFDRADVILSLDADFLFGDPGALRYARDFADKRRVLDGNTEMNRLYAVESTPTLTGSMADNRLRLRPSQVEGFARALAQALGVEADGGVVSGVPAEWLSAVVSDLQAARGRSLVVAGDGQPPVVHALAHAINAALGNAGQTVIYTDPIEADPVNHTQSLVELVNDMNAGQVDCLLILEQNPVFTAPADLQFADAMSKVRRRVHLGLYADETAALCHWHIPAAHFLEAWGDVRAFDGTASVIQPLIAPLYQGKTAFEVLGLFVTQGGTSPYDGVRTYWQEAWTQQGTGEDFESLWKQAVHDGVIPGTAAPVRNVAVRATFPPATPEAGDGLELVFRPDWTIWDGEWANNGWLQELPKPFTKTAWGNLAIVSPGTAEALGIPHQHYLRDTKVYRLTYRDRTVEAPVWVLPGQPDGVVTVHLGHGRQAGGAVASAAVVSDTTGFNAYAIRTADAPWFGAGVELTATRREVRIACTQLHHEIPEGRGIMRSATIEEFRRDAHFVEREEHFASPRPSLYPEWSYAGYAWGMSIDQNACIGCNACVIACQAENNIPVVGRDQVIMGREMHWLRIDTYYKGDAEDPLIHYQPMLCQHCEKAPCEPVCPVAATVHSDEGLNEMVYNRCVGTRYCSNNCPYKVRRFNFLQYSDYKTESLQPMYNPDVTVRMRGVMEKCTFCVQRINKARIEAKKEGRRVRDGEIVTACQSACPTRAIIFGDINDPESGVRRMKAQPQNYAVLGDLNTQPRTTYLAKLWNPNPALAPEAPAAEEAEVHG